MPDTLLSRRAGVVSMALVGTLLAGCAGPTLQYPEVITEQEEATTLPGAVELTETPFFPDETYYCGPAALATVLVSSGVETRASSLVDAVYLPERQGSLQNELVAAARRADRVPFEISADLGALFEEVAAGHPVLILQNLGLEALPHWHYAVLVGYDKEEETVTLRSGTERRETLSMRRFERTWVRAERWAIVVPGPGNLPASATPGDWVAAVAELERQERWSAALDGYRAALARWPEHPDAWLGVGNVQYGQEEYSEAVDAYREAVEHDPSLAAAHHNLAWALLRLDREAEALEAARRSEELAPEHPRYGEAVQQIRQEASLALP